MGSTPMTTPLTYSVLSLMDRTFTLSPAHDHTPHLLGLVVLDGLDLHAVVVRHRGKQTTAVEGGQYVHENL